MDVCWHRSCFKCQLCYNPISGQYYLFEKNRPICYECHRKPPDCYADMARSAAAIFHDGEVMTPLSMKPSGPLTLAIFTDPRFPISEESNSVIQSPSDVAKPENAEIPMEKLPRLSLGDFGLLADQESQSTTKASNKVLSHIQTSSKLISKVECFQCRGYNVVIR
uniref:LIM zinc-binding domain-containing protein n=1 Tax=Romanomermis culicivorax TaxID=13658 RepID=A0A915I9Q3_ROMCU